jgi:hypothetical protein
MSSAIGLYLPVPGCNSLGVLSGLPGCDSPGRSQRCPPAPRAEQRLVLKTALVDSLLAPKRLSAPWLRANGSKSHRGQCFLSTRCATARPPWWRPTRSRAQTPASATATRCPCGYVRPRVPVVHSEGVKKHAPRGSIRNPSRPQQRLLAVRVGTYAHECPWFIQKELKACTKRFDGTKIRRISGNINYYHYYKPQYD